MRRLEALERPARVIAFPEVRPAGRAPPAAVPQRWIAAAAAAGLIVGLGAGELLDLRRTPRLAPRRAPRRAGRRPVGTGTVQPIALNSDDALLYDADPSPRVEALQALDAITPRRSTSSCRESRFRGIALPPSAVAVGASRSLHMPEPAPASPRARVRTRPLSRFKELVATSQP